MKGGREKEARGGRQSGHIAIPSHGGLLAREKSHEREKD